MKTLLILILSSICGMAQNPILVAMRSGGGGGGAPPAAYYSAVFDGISGYVSRGADLAGLSDSKIGLLSFWIERDVDGEADTIMGSASLYFVLAIDASNILTVRAYDAGANLRLSLDSSVPIVVADSWVHVLISWDLGTGGRSYIYLDGVDRTTRNTHSDAALDLTTGDWAIGAGVGGGGQFTGKLSEFYFTTPAAWFDITSSANRDKFFNSSTSKPVDLASDGSTPTGTQPIVYLRTQPTSWESNSGSGGNFTETGSITDGGGDIP